MTERKKQEETEKLQWVERISTSPRDGRQKSEHETDETGNKVKTEMDTTYISLSIAYSCRYAVVVPWQHHAMISYSTAAIIQPGHGLKHRCPPHPSAKRVELPLDRKRQRTSTQHCQGARNMLSPKAGFSRLASAPLPPHIDASVAGGDHNDQS